MTYRIVATNGRETRVVAFTVLGGVAKTEFGDRDVCETHVAWLRATNPGWEFEVQQHGQENRACEPPACH